MVRPRLDQVARSLEQRLRNSTLTFLLEPPSDGTARRGGTPAGHGSAGVNSGDRPA